jgi:hypothetical protein
VSDRELRIEDGYVVGTGEDTVHHRLRALGYSVGGYIDKGVPRYTLYRYNRGIDRYESVHDFDTPEELNNMVKLLLED